MPFRSEKPSFSISIARGALESIFDECDQYDVDETGGRLLGTYHQDHGRYDIEVKGVLEPGPRATRSPTSFLQDGEYQERLFRSIEASHPDIEHLGNWHTHHVNGYPTLSGGDKTTYFKTVNHEKHNTDFFYALLVVSKNRGGNPRYAVKHFVFRRDDDTIYEIPAKEVRLVDAPRMRPPRAAKRQNRLRPCRSRPLRPSPPIRSGPRIRSFSPSSIRSLKPLLSKSIGAPTGRGHLSLVDGSRAEVVAMENADGKAPILLDRHVLQESGHRRHPGAVPGTAIPFGSARRAASGTGSEPGALSRKEGIAA